MTTEKGKIVISKCVSTWRESATSGDEERDLWVECDVTIVIDTDALFQFLGSKAIRSKRRVSTCMDGIVKAQAHGPIRPKAKAVAQ
jgi:hypothetical protein